MAEISMKKRNNRLLVFMGLKVESRKWKVESRKWKVESRKLKVESEKDLA